MKRTDFFIIAGLLLLALLSIVVPFAVAQLATDVNINASANNCTNAVPLVFAANGKRQSVLVIAESTNTASIFLGKAATVTVATGIPIVAGQNFSDNTYIGPWYCVSAANQTFRAYETTR